MSRRQGLAITITEDDSAWTRQEAKVKLDAYYSKKVREALATCGRITVTISVEEDES